MEQSIYEAVKKCDDNYTNLTISEMEGLIDKGRKIVEKYGEENLQNTLREESDFFAAGVFFTYRMIIEDDE